MKKTVDHGPIAYRWGIVIGFVIAWCICKYYPEDSSRWLDVLLGLGVGLIIYIVPIIWIPSPDKTEKVDEEKLDKRQ